MNLRTRRCIAVSVCSPPPKKKYPFPPLFAHSLLLTPLTPSPLSPLQFLRPPPPATQLLPILTSKRLRCIHNQQKKDTFSSKKVRAQRAFAYAAQRSPPPKKNQNNHHKREENAPTNTPSLPPATTVLLLLTSSLSLSSPVVGGGSFPLRVAGAFACGATPPPPLHPILLAPTCGCATVLPEEQNPK